MGVGDEIFFWRTQEYQGEPSAPAPTAPPYHPNSLLSTLTHHFYPFPHPKAPLFLFRLLVPTHPPGIKADGLDDAKRRFMI